MPVNPLIVNELRALFKAGATPSALIRHTANCHAGEAKLDVLVRAYFREAFHVPMLRVGPEQVRQIADGGSLPILNVTVLPRMIQARKEWDTDSSSSWMNGVEEASSAGVDLQTIPELAGSWDRLDDEAKQFIQRTIGTSRALHEHVNTLAVLAEQLQQQATVRVTRKAQRA